MSPKLEANCGAIHDVADVDKFCNLAKRVTPATNGSLTCKLLFRPIKVVNRLIKS